MPFDDWKTDATSDREVVSVCFNRRLYGEWKQAAAKLRDANDAGQFDPELAQRVADLADEVDADKAAHTFTFELLPYSRWRELVEEYPPTDEQKAANRYLDYNPDTFPPVAVSAACVDPELSDEDGQWLRDHLPRLEFDRLFEAVLSSNVGGGDLPKSVVAIARTLASRQRSITAAK